MATIKQWILAYKDKAIKAANKYGVPYSVVLGITYIESNKSNGISELARLYNNFGGVRFVPKYHKDFVTYRENAYDANGITRTPHKFAKYATVQDGFNDIARIVRLHYQGINPQNRLHNLAKKYAEDKRYETLLTKTINTISDTKIVPNRLNIAIPIALMAASAYLFAKK
jgi:flagellum-specific peptidoglycan hydrolase FlgJ